MCKFCEVDNDGDLCVKLADDGHKPNEKTGLFLYMENSRGMSIVNSQFKQHETHDNKIYYLKAMDMDKETKRHRTIAAEIKYCPFCGSKL